MTESRIVAAALACIALYVADDNFFHPERGVSASAHVASGAALLGALVALVLVYPRIRPGWRAIFALPLGLFAVVAGASDSGYHTVQEGLGGDDLSGFVALVAGVVLVATSVVVCWRSRRLGDGLPRRYARRTLKVALAVVAAYFLLFPWALAYLFAHVARSSVPAPRLGAAYENVSFRTSDGLTLHGWYVPSRNRAAVISAPGRGGSQRPARVLVRHGFGVLLFDRRGEGESDGDPNAFGWNADKDLNAAVAYLQHRPDVDRNRIGGIGLSVGGETLLQAAAESDGLKAIVADGAGSRSIREDLARPGSGKWGEIPTSLVITAGTMLFSNHAPPPNLERLVGRIAPRPVFLIYGAHDQDNVRDLAPIYYAAAGQPKQIWQVPGAGHTGGIVARPKEYERRVIGFFDRALHTREQAKRWR